MNEERTILHAMRATAGVRSLRSATLAAAARAIKKGVPLAEEFLQRTDQHLLQAKQALASFRSRNLGRFDLFETAGFSPGENEYSDALRALLDPNGKHGLGKKPLLALVRALPSRANKQALLDEIGRTACARIRVLREISENHSRVDIVVQGPRFCLFVENKIRGGRETRHEMGPQTKRQSEALKRRAARLFDENDPRYVGILLTPEEHQAASPAYFPVSTGRLATELRTHVAVQPAGSSAINILAFLDFYSWHN